MPGLIIETNTKQLIGSEIQWEYNIYKSFFNSYQIKVVSRTINVWCYLVTGLILLAGIFGLGLKIRKVLRNNPSNA